MFDKLVESTQNRQRSRAGRFLFLTGLIYATMLTVLAVWTIMGFSPGLADGIDLTRLPPVPYTATPPVIQRTMQTSKAPAVNGFVTPTGENKIPRPEELPQLERTSGVRIPGLVTGPLGPNTGLPPGNFSPVGSGDGIAPPPAPKPRPTPEPTPAPTPKQQLTQVSKGVIQGAAIVKPPPIYPPLARQARVEGAVQILVTISEEGRVLEAAVVNGHPLLRQAALDAARRWVFNPTTLSEVPVKVQGILTFNFTLN
jgi:periplasmic protein TonB